MALYPISYSFKAAVSVLRYNVRAGCMCMFSLHLTDMTLAKVGYLLQMGRVEIQLPP